MKNKKVLAAVTALVMTAGQMALPVSAEEQTVSKETVSATGSDTATKDAEVTDGETTDDETTDSETTDSLTTDDGSTNAEDKEHILGDISGDDNINVTDIAMLASHIKGISALGKSSYVSADVNLDGQVDVTDIAMIAAHIKGIKAIVDPKTLPKPDVIHYETTNFTTSYLRVNRSTGKITWKPVNGMTDYTLEFKGNIVRRQFTKNTSVAIPYELFNDGKLTLRVMPSRDVQSPEGRAVRDFADGYEFELTILPEKIEGDITAKSDDKSTQVSWKAADLATAYNIYLVNSNGDEQFIAKTNETSYTIDNSVIKENSKVKIVPVNSVGSADTASEVKIELKKEIKLTAPVITGDTPDYHKAEVRWNAVEGAEGYEASIKVEGNWQIYNVTSNSCTFSKLRTHEPYDVRVRAFRKEDGKTVYGDYAEYSVFTDCLLKSAYGTYIYASKDTNSTVLGTVAANTTIRQKGPSANGWTAVYVPNTNSQIGYIQMAGMYDYTNLGLKSINQDSWNGGQPAVLGCEETALASVLNGQFGIDVGKNTLIDYYMPEVAFYNGYVNVDPNYAFWGSPYHMEATGGYGVYAPVIAQSANQYLRYIGERDKYDISLYTDYYTGNNKNGTKFDPSKLDLGDTKISGGLDIDGLKAELEKGHNIIMWYSEVAPYVQNSMTLTKGEKYTNPGSGTYTFTWYGRQHTAVLTGYDNAAGCFIVANVEDYNNPGNWYGPTDYEPYESFMNGYNALGRQAVVISKK